MSEVIEQIMDRPLWQRVAGWVGSLLFFTYIFWTYFYSDLSEELVKLLDKTETLETQIAHEKRLAKNLPKVKAQVKELDIQLKKAMMELPDKKEIPDLLASISDLAMDSGLEVQLFKPKAENFREFYAEVPVQISVGGTYHQVATFFDEVGHLSRIVNISAIGIKDPKIGDNDVQVNTECVATTFRYLDESERAKRSSKTSGKRKRR
jgi:type IV pilus assembly protein PilO